MGLKFFREEDDRISKEQLILVEALKMFPLSDEQLERIQIIINE